MLELELDRVQKQYGRHIAVDEVSCTFQNGVYGLLGANGAGKTTLLRIICGVLSASRGEVLCNGKGIRQLGGEYRRLLGYLPQEFGYYPEFTARRFLHYLASLKALPADYARERTIELLELVELSGERDRRIKTFSGGMLRRLGIAQAMLNNPEILILDEPTAGLDPKERIRFRNIISALSKNRIVILSTHIVSDVEYIADEILLMRKGRLIAQDTSGGLIKLVEGKVWELETDTRKVEEYQKRFPVSNLRNTQEGVRLRLIAEQCPEEGAEPVEGTLEDLYLYYFADQGMTACPD